MGTTAATITDSVTASSVIVARRMDKGAILMNTANGDCFELNDAGASVWDLIGRGLDLPAIVDELVRKFAVDRATAHADLLRLVDDFAQRGIVIINRP